MATQKTATTFLSTYNDDFRDSDHFHRILFNNGRALQARELTQAQTIIQAELAKVAGFIFKEGSLFNSTYGGLNSGFSPLDFVKVTSLPTGFAQLKGLEVSTGGGVAAVVKDVIDATGADPATLVLKYITSNNTSSSNTALGPKIFEASDTLSYNDGSGFSGTLTVQTTNTVGNPATGKTSYIEIDESHTFAAGHIVMAEAQSLVISKYSASPTDTVGFKLAEEIITVADDVSLYDNAGSTPNLTSPGADRYRITLTLDLLSNLQTGETFYSVMELVNGRVVKAQSQDTVLNELGKIINDRSYSTTGNFIERDNENGSFELMIEPDSADTHLLYNLQGGAAFVGGQRITKGFTTSVRVEKPRSLTTDIEEVSNEFMNAEYGSYFVTDQNLKGMIKHVDSLGLINLYDQTNIASGATVIGTTRLRHVDEVDNSFRVFVFDTKMDSSAGTAYSVTATRSIGTDSDNFANLRQINRSFDLYHKPNSNLLFHYPRPRVNAVTGVSMAVRKIYTDTTNGSGEATFSTGSSNIFTDTENWIVSVDSSGQIFSPPTTSGTINTSATVTGLPASSAVRLLGFETITATRKTKTLNTGQVDTIAVGGNRSFKTSKRDVYKFTSIVDTATGHDITEQYVLDNGQRDDYYTLGGGKLKSGAAIPAANIQVTYDWFSHSAGDFFAGKASYPSVNYEEIPTHIAGDGFEYRLADVIDMRPSKDDTGANFTGTGAVIEPIPKSGGLITTSQVDYWQPRVDILTLNSEGVISNYKGPTNLAAAEPQTVPDDEMKLHKVTLFGYTLDHNDLFHEPYSNYGYKMRDIENLEDRIENLEAAVTLNRAELEAVSVTVPDPTNSTLPDRVKLGLTADGFKTNNQSDIFNLDHRVNLSRETGTIAPYTFERTVDLVYDSAASTNTVIKGGTIWPKYTEEVMITQDVASKPINVNAFDISKSIGGGILAPTQDTWTEQRKVNNKYRAQSQKSFLGNIGNAIDILSQGHNRS